MSNRLRLGASAAALLLVVAAAGIARADVYRWTDEKGQTHFTGDLNQVPARYRAQAAEPLESKSTINVHESQAAPAQPTTTSPAAATTSPAAPTTTPVPRIKTDVEEPTRPRMADFEEKPPEPEPAPARKYFRDCSNPNRRCRSTLNPEWVRENEARKAKEAAADAEE